jgi:hypothetical protein
MFLHRHFKYGRQAKCTVDLGLEDEHVDLPALSRLV